MERPSLNLAKGYYQVNNYPNDAANQTTARDLGNLFNHFINNPDILNYTNQAQVTVKKGTPYEETFDTYNYSLPGAKYALKGVDGLKLIRRILVDFSNYSDHQTGQSALNCCHYGRRRLGDQDGEYYRHPFGNALIEKHKDFAYKNC